MRMKYKAVLSAVLALCLLLCACAPTPAYQGVEQTVTYLASDELAGRLPGEKGNRLTQAFLTDALELLNIPPAFQAYAHSYDRPLAAVKECSLSVGGRTLSYPATLELLRYSPNALSLTELALATPENIPNSPCILLLEEGDAHTVPPSSVVAILSRRDATERKPQLTEDKKGALPLLAVSTADFDALLADAQDKARAALTLRCEEIVTQENNIVGKLAAPQPAREAVVVSAHFDHLGVSPSGEIFHGAYDNASGVAAVLRIEQELSAALPSPEMTRDLYFAFFNTEESGLSVSGGSRALAQLLEEEYDAVYDINLDCLGAPDKPLSISLNPRAEQLGLDAVSFFEEASEPAAAFDGASDHRNFALGVTLSTGFDDINSLIDTLARVDFDRLESLALFIGRYAAALACGRELPAKQAGGESNRAALYAAGMLPRFDECMLQELDGKLCHIYSDCDGSYLLSDVDARYGLSLAGLAYDQIDLYGVNDREGTGSLAVTPFPLPEGERCQTGLTSAEHGDRRERISRGTLPFTAVGRVVVYLNDILSEDTLPDGKKYPYHARLDLQRYSLDDVAQSVAFEQARLFVAKNNTPCGAYGGWELFMEAPSGSLGRYEQFVYGIFREEDRHTAYLLTLRLPAADSAGFRPDENAALCAYLDTQNVAEICSRLLAAWSAN